MNEYDSNRILDLVKKINYTPTRNIEETNCYILNTCHIREKATDKVYHEIGRVKKEFRNRNKPIVIVLGCVAQAEGDILMKREKFLGIPSYADRDISEGSIYHVLMYGINLMGSHAGQVNEEERWQIAQYVMKLREELEKK